MLGPLAPSNDDQTFLGPLAPPTDAPKQIWEKGYNFSTELLAMEKEHITNLLANEKQFGDALTKVEKPLEEITITYHSNRIAEKYAYTSKQESLYSDIENLMVQTTPSGTQTGEKLTDASATLANNGVKFSPEALPTNGDLADRTTGEKNDITNDVIVAANAATDGMLTKVEQSTQTNTPATNAPEIERDGQGRIA